MWVIFYFVLILIGIIWYLRKKHTQKQSFFQHQWANFEVDMKTMSVSLYKRHNKSPEMSINISSIVCSEILLNDDIISTISADDAHAFSNELEALVLATFGNEHRIKMMNDKHRKIQLCFTDEHKQRYMICLYYRVGNIRHTKLKYQQTIDNTIDWQWLFSQFINPNATTKRKVKAKPTPIKVVASSENKSPAMNISSSDTFEDNSTMVGPNNDELAAQSTDIRSTETSTNSIDITATKSSLVADLDKLVMMKKQGYLNESEFNAAKAKILQDLANN